VTTFLNILVAVDGRSSSRALEVAVSLAELGNAKMTLITVAPTASSYVTLAGVSPRTMQAELDKWAATTLLEAAEKVPDKIAAHTVQGTGHAGPVILKELKRRNYDLVVLGTRGRGPAQEGLLGSVNGYLHFHSKVPILSVPDTA
jgi:nucleotide-binding universal stress UspA family protein